MQCWGEGGNGGTSAHGSHAGGGGGGGAYGEETSAPCTPGTGYPYTIGGGGSSTVTTITLDGGVTVSANFGGNSPGQTAGSAGSAGSNSIAFAGGAGAGGAAGNNQNGAGGGGSAGASSGGGTASGSTGGTAGSGGGAAGASGAGSLVNGAGGTIPGSGGSGGGSGGTLNHTGGPGAAGQITLTYTATTLHSGAAALSGTGTMTIHTGSRFGGAALSGSGTLTASGLLAAAAALSGTGTLTAAGTSTGMAGAALAGTGTITVGRKVTWGPPAVLSGTGVLSAHTVGFSAASLSGTGVLGTVLTREIKVQLSGSGALGAGQVVLGFSAHLAGTGQLSVSRVLGVVTAGASRGMVTTPQIWPGTSQVAICSPGGFQYHLGRLGQVTALKYSYMYPGGADKMSATVMLPATFRHQMETPGWTVRIYRGGHQVWSGKLDEPVYSREGCSLTAVGTGNRGQDFLAIYSSTWPANQPDESINNAASRGLPWINQGVGQPAGAWFGQSVDSGAQTISALLNLICLRGGLGWYVNSQPGGQLGDDLTVAPVPTAPNRILIATSPVSRTLHGDINTIYLRYQITADSTDGSGNSTPATFGTVQVQNAASVAAHGELETFVDISDAGTMSSGQVQTVGNYILGIYQRASFAGPFTGKYGDLLTTGGYPIDPGTDQAGTMCRLIMTDFAYGGEVTPQFPVTFVTGSYEWDDFGCSFTITPYQSVNQSLTGLLSMENTLLTPIQAATGAG